MRVLMFGAGPLGSLYAHRFHEAGTDVTLLARGERYDWLRENGLVVRDEMTGTEGKSNVKLVNAVSSDDSFDLAIVLVRKNRLPAVFAVLAPCVGIKNLLFMGNNALGFDDYLSALPPEKLLFGFPGAGGGFKDQVLHYADRESPKGERRPVTIGEVDGQTSERLLAVKALFEAAGVSVDTPASIDGWLRYHVALVSPLVGALYKHNCDNYELAGDKQTLRILVRAANEGRRVLDSLGFADSAPGEFKLMKWLPEFMSAFALRKMLESKFAEVAFGMHAVAARDEMVELASEFQLLIEKTDVETTNINLLKTHTESFTSKPVHIKAAS